MTVQLIHLSAVVGDVMDGRESLFAFRPIVAICPSCDEVGVVRVVGGKCWMCGGWVGHRYPIKLAMRVSGVFAGRVGSLS